MKMKEKLNDVLVKMAEDMVAKTGSLAVWGEIDIPKCLKDEDEE